MPTIYAYDGDYDYLESSSTSWLDGKQHFYLDTSYTNRLYFTTNLGQAGKAIAITSATFQLWRNDGDSHTGTMTIVRNGGTVTNSASVSGGTGRKTLYLNEAFCKDLSNYINTGATYFRINMNGTSSAGEHVRVTGYGNTSYQADQYPRFNIVWDYAKSTATIDSSFLYNAPAILNISAYDTTYTHTVNWYINEETTPYYTQNLAAGVTSASCTFFGSNASGAALSTSDYFTGDTVSAKVVLATYDSTGALFGENSYSFNLERSTVYAKGKLSAEKYNYTDNVYLTFTPSDSTYYYKTKWYIKGDRLMQTHTYLNVVTTSVTSTYQYFGSLNVSTYFPELTDKCPGYVILETYDSSDALVGSATYPFILQYTGRTRQSVELSVNPVIMTSSIVVNNPTTKAQDTVENTLNSFKNFLVDRLHPIGSIYLTTGSENPSTLFGGTWEVFAPARTIVSTLDANLLETTNGSFTHTLTANQMPSHCHGLYYAATVNSAGSASVDIGGGWSGSYTLSGEMGDSKAHNNTQPYQTCKMWKRIS